MAHISALLLFLGCGLLAASVPDLLRRRSLVDPSRTSVAGALLVIAAVLPPLGWTWLLLVPVVVLARVGMVPSARARLARDPTMWLALAVALLLAPWT